MTGSTKAQIQQAFHKACDHAVSLGYVDIRRIGYKLSFNKRTRAVGLCHYGKMEVQISLHFMKTNSVEILYQTLLHEVAHALNPGDGHGTKWKRTFIALGGSGERLNKIAQKTDVKPKYRVINRLSGEVVAEYQRKPKWDFTKAGVKGDPSSYGNLVLEQLR